MKELGGGGGGGEEELKDFLPLKREALLGRGLI